MGYRCHSLVSEVGDGGVHPDLKTGVVDERIISSALSDDVAPGTIRHAGRALVMGEDRSVPFFAIVVGSRSLSD